MKNKKYFEDDFDEALKFAATAHYGQFRKDARVPYIVHPVSVAMILHRAGFGKDVVIAGLLHDVAEDTKFTIEDIKKKFGAKVAKYVAAVTENKKLSWEKRKEHAVKMLKTAPVEVKALKAADKLHNVQSMIKAVELNPKVWKKFNRNKQTTLSNHILFAEQLKKYFKNPLADELNVAVARLRKISK